MRVGRTGRYPLPPVWRSARGSATPPWMGRGSRLFCLVHPGRGSASAAVMEEYLETNPAALANHMAHHYGRSAPTASLVRGVLVEDRVHELGSALLAIAGAVLRARLRSRPPTRPRPRLADRTAVKADRPGPLRSRLARPVRVNPPPSRPTRCKPGLAERSKSPRRPRPACARPQDQAQPLLVPRVNMALCGHVTSRARFGGGRTSCSPLIVFYGAGRWCSRPPSSVAATTICGALDVTTNVSRSCGAWCSTPRPGWLVLSVSRRFAVVVAGGGAARRAREASRAGAARRLRKRHQGCGCEAARCSRAKMRPSPCWPTMRGAS